MKFIKFTLSAPLQSWGDNSRWDNRNTANMPTKSGIIGLLGCCLGYPRGDERLNRLDQQLHLAVRSDRAGRIMTDFHTVHGTYGVLLSAEGKKRQNGNTIVSKRQYLQDARFTVFLWGAEADLERCYQAMSHPKWTIYLGRKSCVPSLPVKPEWLEASTPEEAAAIFSETERRLCDRMVNVEIEMLPEDTLSSKQRLITRQDSVIRADRNEYAARYVRAYTIRCGGEEACT